MKKYILPVSLGIIAGYVMYYYIVMEIVTMFCYTTQHKLAYQIICVVSLVATVALCSLVFFAIINRTLSQNLLRIVYCCYFLVALYILFGRRPLEQVFIWNPIESIVHLNEPEMLVESIFNILLFMPVGILLRKWRFNKMLIFSVGLAFVIDLIQGFSRRGYFDTWDIILYILGIAISYFVARKCGQLRQGHSLSQKEAT